MITNDVIRIINDEDQGLLTFKFLNGDMILPTSSKYYGAYAICPGCGAGKTTLIRELIKYKWHEGILYTAFTIDEVNSMYRWIISNLDDINVIGARDCNRGKLTANDIIVLHSDSTDNNAWKSTPEIVMSKRIVLCTHHKLLNEPIQLLVRSEFVGSNIFTSKQNAMRGIGGNLPRQWILIDEGIESGQVRKVIDKSGLLCMASLTRKEVVVDEETNEVKVTELRDPKVIRGINSYFGFKEKFLLFSQLSKPLSDILYKGGTNLDDYRNDQILEEIYDDFEYYMNRPGDKVSVTYGFSSLSFKDMSTHLLLFDGTSDITLKNSKKFRLMTYPDKYSGDLKLSIVPFNLERKIKNDRSVADYDQYIKDKLDSVVDMLSNVINENNQTLIFTWKNFKYNGSEENDDIDDPYSGDLVTESRELKLNSNFSLPSYITSRLEERGYREGVNFSIEYYGSGRDKAINDYRNYDAVVMLGKYVVPRSAIDNFSISYRTNITEVEYYTNRVIQAICRTRIRLHKSLGVNIYMSSDWSGNVINAVKSYLGIDKIHGSKIPDTSGISIDYMYSKLRELGISPKRAEKIAKLSTYDSNIFSAIVSGVKYSTDISLDDIYAIIPMSRKKVNEYYSTISLLRTYGVNLNIDDTVIESVLD